VKQFFCGFLLCCFLFPLMAEAAPLTLDDVLASSSLHHPRIAEARATLAAREGSILKAEGAFDTELNSTLSTRPSGYYDGQQIDTKLVKPLPYANAKIMGGYRVSDGIFPIYEDKNYTNDGGEFNLGVVLSLWRDRAIDERRYQLRDSNLRLNEAELMLTLTRLETQHAAMRAYIGWLAAGRAVEVFRNLVEVAEKRQRGLETQASLGEVARIVLTENRQAILRRKSQLNEAERLFRNAANTLALYYRTPTGEMIQPEPEQLPATFPALASLMPEGEASVKQSPEKQVTQLLQDRPDIQVLQNALNREELKLLMGENRIAPRVDLSLEGAQDQGGGSITREGTESIAMLNVSIPLQTRAGEGQIAEARAAIRELEQRQRLLADKIRTELGMIANDITAAAQNVTLTTGEVEAAEQMEAAERTRFREGASDFFVLNMREERSADARLKQIDAQEKQLSALSNYLAATLQFEQLGLKKGN
jgi:outer membrane protein TolC